MRRELVEALRNPEYTGENRCPPCTVVNLALAFALGWLVSKKSKPAGAIAAAGSVGLIYLRGYLVPGTPELTGRYLPPEVLRWFGKEPEPDIATGLGAEPAVSGNGRSKDDGDGNGEGSEESRAAPANTENGERTGETGEIKETGETEENPDDLETYLLRANILEPCEERDDLCLTEAFESEWLETIDEAVESGVDTEATVEAFGFEADPDEFELEAKDDGVYALRYGSKEIGDGPRYQAGMWPSHAALVADVAASRVLDSWLEDWEAYDSNQKGPILNGIRMFLETCPTADGNVELTEETVQSCCSSETVIAGVCEETGERLFEHQVPS